jgi:hypothetical protein
MAHSLNLPPIEFLVALAVSWTNFDEYKNAYVGSAPLPVLGNFTPGRPATTDRNQGLSNVKNCAVDVCA